MAAIYTAHFMAPSVKRVVKPVMEIMASLPAVVLGFFGARYLAPRMEDKVPALLCMAVLMPGLAALIAWFWTTRPAACLLYTSLLIHYLRIIKTLIKERRNL